MKDLETKPILLGKSLDRQDWISKCEALQTQFQCFSSKSGVPRLNVLQVILKNWGQTGSLRLVAPTQLVLAQYLNNIGDFPWGIFFNVYDVKKLDSIAYIRYRVYNKDVKHSYVMV